MRSSAIPTAARWSTVTHYPGNNTTVTLHLDDRVETQLPDRSVMTYIPGSNRNEAPSVHLHPADAPRVVNFPDGSIMRRGGGPDGTTRLEYPDGRIYDYSADGNNRFIHPNVSGMESDANGTIRIVQMEGPIVQTTHDVNNGITLIEGEDRSVTIQLRDGSSAIRHADGRVVDLLPASPLFGGEE
jgi:hypothetical protein